MTVKLGESSFKNIDLLYLQKFASQLPWTILASCLGNIVSLRQRKQISRCHQSLPIKAATFFALTERGKVGR